MASERKAEDGKVLDDEAIASRPRIQRIVLTYIDIEDIMISKTIRANIQATIEQEK